MPKTIGGQVGEAGKNRSCKRFFPIPESNYQHLLETEPNEINTAEYIEINRVTIFFTNFYKQQEKEI